MVPLLTLDVVRQKLKDKGVAVEEVRGMSFLSCLE